MDWTLHIDPAVNCAFIKRPGVYDSRDTYEVLNAMVNHPDHREDTNILYDARDLRIPTDEPFESMSESYKFITQIYSNKADTCRSAIVVGDAQNYAKAHQYTVSGRLDKSTVERKVFRNMEKALRWLYIPEDYEIKYPAIVKCRNSE